MSTYSEFFLASSRASVQLELVEISHPNFSKTYRRVRNARKGVIVTLEDSTSGVFEYAPMKITNKGTRADLDNGLTISFGDLGQILPKEIDNVRSNNGFATQPAVVYRVYNSDDLTAPLLGPLSYIAKTFSFVKAGVSFDAVAPGLNYSATGLLYRLDDFPMLRGAL
jgi:hypothetical protein